MKGIIKAIGYMLFGILFGFFAWAFIVESAGADGSLAGKTFRCGNVEYQIMVKRVK